MRNLVRLTLFTCIFALVFSTAFVSAQTASPASPAAVAQQPIALPAPQTTGGMPLMQTLNNRKTTRAFSDQPLSMQQLSNLLWAGFGVNRPQGPNNKPGRTAPSGRNSQEIELYVVLAQGIYVYDAQKNELKPVASGDLRARIGTPAVHAAATIVFVAPVKADFAQVDTGFIGQNMYLYAASEGLNAWFYAALSKDVPQVLGLGSDKAPLYGESIGFPQK